MGRSVRILRTYRRMAQMTHFCDRCMELIQPGELYGAYVEVRAKKLRVFKEHIEPHCEYPDEPVDESRGAKSHPQKRPLPLAA